MLYTVFMFYAGSLKSNLGTLISLEYGIHCNPNLRSQNPIFCHWYYWLPVHWCMQYPSQSHRDKVRSPAFPAVNHLFYPLPLRRSFRSHFHRINLFFFVQELINLLDNNDILTDRQNGFRLAKRSTETQLLHTVHDFTSDIEKENTIHVGVLDLSKAFDKVLHERLLNKVKT